jgi:hypothetical protein
VEGKDNPVLGNIQEEPTVPYSPGEGTSSSLRVFTPRGQSTPRTSPTGTPVPVITLTPSLEWDTSCLQDPFSGGQSDLLGIHRLSDRRSSDTDPNLLDSNKIPIVSTDTSSLSITLDSSFLKLVEPAGHLSSIVGQDTVRAPTMESEAEEIMGEVDAIMGVMEGFPVAEIPDEFLDDGIMRMESLGNDVTAILKLNRGWVRKYKEETGPVKAQLDAEISKMKVDFQAYQTSMAAKKKALRASGPPPAVAMPSANNGQAMIQHLQRREDEDRTMNLVTKYNQVRVGIAQLLTSMGGLDWDEADDADIQEAVRKLDRWESKSVDILNEFQAYKGMISSYHPDQLTIPSSEYGGLNDYVKSFIIGP